MPHVIVAPLFVLLWSTGFIGARMGLPHAEPLTFLTLRFGLAVLLLGVWVRLSGAPWPTRDQAARAGLAGLLVHGGYLGGVFWAIGNGLEAGVAALIVGLQPVLSAILAGPVLGERVGAKAWAGIALGFAGVALTVSNRLSLGVGAPVDIGVCVLALLAITAGSLYQKARCGDVPVRAGNVVQFMAAGIVVGLLALVLETNRIEWTGDFVFALGWLVIVLSFGAITLYYRLLREGAATKVTSLFFLTPPVAALLAWILFDEALGATAIAGFVLASLGVAIVTRHQPK